MRRRAGFTANWELVPLRLQARFSPLFSPRRAARPSVIGLVIDPAPAGASTEGRPGARLRLPAKAPVREGADSP